MAELEKRQASTQSECLMLRQELITTQDLLKTAEATKAEIAIDVAARRAQIGELESRLGQEGSDNRALREENQRLDDRLLAAEKRIVILESDLNSTRQRLLMAEDEKRALQASLDKSVTDAARLTRKLAETENSLTTVHGRLRNVEANFAEISTERGPARHRARGNPRAPRARAQQRAHPLRGAAGARRRDRKAARRGAR